MDMYICAKNDRKSKYIAAVKKMVKKTTALPIQSEYWILASACLVLCQTNSYGFFCVGIIVILTYESIANLESTLWFYPYFVIYFFSNSTLISFLWYRHPNIEFFGITTLRDIFFLFEDLEIEYQLLEDISHFFPVLIFIIQKFVH